MPDDLNPKDKPYASGPLGLDPDKMKALRSEAEKYSNSMLNTSEFMKSQLDSMQEIRREEKLRSQAVDDYLSKARDISRELTNQADFLDDINDGEIQLSEAKKLQEKTDKKIQSLRDNANVAQTTLNKKLADGEISKKGAAGLQQGILDNLSEASTLQDKMAKGVAQAGKGSNAFTKNIGGLGKVMKKAGFENASKHMGNMAKGVSKAKIAGGGFAKQMMSASRAAKLNPYILIASIIIGFVKMLLKANQESAELGRNMGVSAHEASSIKEHFISVAKNMGKFNVEYRDIATQQNALNKSLGTASVIHGDIIGFAAVLKERWHLTQESITGAMKVALVLGKTTEKISMSALKGSRAAGKELGVRVDTREVMNDILKTSGQLRGIYGANMELIGKAVTKAKLLGFTLGEVAGQSRKMLDFQSSIEAEMEAELFLGRQLNLEKARLLALTGSYSEYQDEILLNAGDFFSFSKLNVMQQDKLAAALGMSSDALSDMLFAQETMASLQEAASTESDKALAAHYEQLSVQEKFNGAMEKLKYLVINLVNRLENRLSGSWIMRKLLGIQEGDFQVDKNWFKEDGEKTSTGRQIVGQSRIQVNDFKLETHPKDTFAMVGGTNLTKFGGDSNSQGGGWTDGEKRDLLRSNKENRSFEYNGFAAVKESNHYGGKFGSQT